METRINIAEILRNKPSGIRLYSPIFGDCTYCYIHDETGDICVKRQHNVMIYFNFEGLYDTAGECLLFPSKKMRDWSKFAWKKGDVLTNSSGFQIFFDKWANEDYTKFLGKIKVLGNSHCYDPANYSLASKEEALEFIKSVEEINNGKLNLETLRIEKSEFKDGDIVCISGMGYLAYGIVKSINNSSKKLEYYVLNDMSTLKFEDWLSFEDKQIQPITETQQIILFDALARENKAWDAEKIQIVDLKPKYEFKPFDKVLGRNEKYEVWEADFFSYYREESQYPFRCIGFNRKYCIPYNEETAHLLGTTDEWKGGEG